MILTTRIDLALEFALVRHGTVNFTRIIPTLQENAQNSDQRRAVENWEWDRMPDWCPDPPRWIADGPWVDYPDLARKRRGEPDKIKLLTTSMRSAHPIVLVKLCGSLDVRPSLMLTISDFFECIEKLDNLPQDLRKPIRFSPQLLIGCGFASPLAQLVRLRVLGAFNQSSPRILVTPDTLAGTTHPAAPVDYLHQLERRLIKQEEDVFKRVLGLTHLHREDQHQFIDRLAAML